MNQVAKLFFLSILFALTFLPPSFAQDKPAVSRENSKLSFSAGDLDGHEIILFSGSYTTPLSHQFGFQVDALAAYSMDDLSAGLGGHLFWRDPEDALLGLYGAYTDRGWPNIDEIGNLALELELYLDDITLSGHIGREFGDSTKIYGIGLLSWYSESEDSHIYGGAGYQHGLEMIYFGVEYDPKWQAAKNATLFLNSIYAGCDETLIHVGVRFYFGAPKSLKVRHREDDPIVTALPGNLLNLDSCGSTAMVGGGGGGL